MGTKRFTDKALTLRKIWEDTYQYKKSRFNNKKRDVIKKVYVDTITSLTLDRLNIPSQKFRITSYSYPQYYPYNKVKGKRSKNQRTIRHEYDVTLELEELSLDSRFYWRVGSQRKWPNRKTIPQSKIKTIRRETMTKWKNKYPDKKRRDKIIKRHRKKAPFVNEGDYISRMYGLNGDFYFRIQYNLNKRGMLFGKCWVNDAPEDKNIFFDKHTINILEYLMRSKKITY